MSECRRLSKTHRDAVALVEWLIDHRGRTELVNEDIAQGLGWVQSRPGGVLSVDRQRFYRAKNHINDGTIDDEPCCGFRVNYRKSGRYSIFELIDPLSATYPATVVAEYAGHISRMRQHHTENQRLVAMWKALASERMGFGDIEAATLCNRAAVEIAEFGIVKPPTLAELTVWVESLSA